MIPFQKILCPVDFSGSSTDALKTAAELTAHFGAELWVVHVVMPIPALTASPAVYPESPNLPKFEEELEDTSRHTLAKIMAERIPEGVTAHAVLLVGEAGHEINNFAEQNGIDLIVISTHGRTGWKRLMFGSITEKVVRHAHCAVLTLRVPPPTGEER